MRDFMLWCDLETAGTDEKQHPILEVAVVITQPDLTVLGSYESAIWPDHWNNVRAELPYIDPVAMRMHTDSGLWDDCARSDVRLYEAEGRICSLMRDISQGTGQGFVLAGSGVSHSDRRFIDEQMPKLATWLRYYSIDVGVLRRTLEAIGREDLIGPAPLKPHRAMQDVLLHIEELRRVKDAIGDESTGVGAQGSRDRGQGAQALQRRREAMPGVQASSEPAEAAQAWTSRSGWRSSRMRPGRGTIGAPGGCRTASTTGSGGSKDRAGRSRLTARRIVRGVRRPRD